MAVSSHFHTNGWSAGGTVPHPMPVFVALPGG